MSEVITDKTSSVSVTLGAKLARDQLPLDASYRAGIFVPLRLTVTAAITERGLEVFNVRVTGAMVKKDGTLSKNTGNAVYAPRVTGELTGCLGAVAGMTAPADIQAAYEELMAGFIASTRLAMEAAEPRAEDYMTEADYQTWGRL